MLNPAQDPYGVGTILASLHNAGPSCSQYPGLMITTDTPGVTFPYASSYEAEGQIVNWWYAIFAGDTYFSSTTFEVSPFIPQGTEINFTIETVKLDGKQKASTARRNPDRIRGTVVAGSQKHIRLKYHVDNKKLELEYTQTRLGESYAAAKMGNIGAVSYTHLTLPTKA